MSSTRNKENTFTYLKTNGANKSARWVPCHNGRQLFQLEVRKITHSTSVNIGCGHYVTSHYEAVILGHVIKFDSLNDAKKCVTHHLQLIFA